MASPECFTLYRFFAGDDTLLYVGLTINPGRRMEKHRGEKPWWPDVSRITMEQHPTLDALRLAERKAITTEAPRYNIRMNGVGVTSHTDDLQDDEPDGLTGRSFHTWRPASDEDSEYVTRRGDRVLEWQGRVLERIDANLYLIETFSWLDGEPYEQKLVHIDAMASWTFYGNNIEMVAALGCREQVDRRTCGGPAAYITTNVGLGSSAVCDHCAGYYGSVHPIVWRNGKATLGPKTKIPHPLSVEGMSRQ